MGPFDAASTRAAMYGSWFRDHAGGRSEWFRDTLLPRIEMRRPLDGLRVLDFGCGTGSSTVVLAERGANVVGAETERVSIEIAAQRIADLSVEDRCDLVQIPYIDGVRVGLPFADASMDCCTLIGVLEHMYPSERPACAREISRVIRPGGELFIFDTPNRAHPFDHHTAQLWFLGWIPQRIARWYAVARKRFDPSHDFRRYGGQGITRGCIDRLFPADEWNVSYEKSADEIAKEFAWLGARLTIVPQALRPAVTRKLPGLVRAWFSVMAWLGLRPAYWTASHTIGLSKKTPPG